MRVTALWRYPVKSMGGEQLETVTVTASGVTGDRRWAVIDRSDGRVASAKYPRKWAALLDCRAETDGDGVRITLPDGSTACSGEPGVDALLSNYLARDVTLSEVVPEGASYEGDWPEGAIPDAVLRHVVTGQGDEGALTELPLPSGSFLDVAPLHLVSTGSLDAIGDVRRFRPNVVIAGGEDPFEENAWVGRTFAIGGAAAAVTMSTMRCVMTTLPQAELARDRGVLRTLTERNRLDIPGFGIWSCLGAYATVAAPGQIRIGDAVSAG